MGIKAKTRAQNEEANDRIRQAWRDYHLLERQRPDYLKRYNFRIDNITVGGEYSVDLDKDSATD